MRHALEGAGSANPAATPSIVGDRLIGTASHGGAKPRPGRGSGVLYAMALDGSDLASRIPGTGSHPLASLTPDRLGHAWGAMQGGGADGGGGVFRIDAQNNDEWLHGVVGGLNAGGADPTGSMLPAGDGKLSGTTTVGGACPCFCGMVDRIDPATSAVEIVWGFTGKDGGASNNGVIFRLTLQSPERPEAPGRRVMGMARNQREGWTQPTGRHRPAPSRSCAAAHRRAAPHVHYRPCSRQGGPSA